MKEKILGDLHTDLNEGILLLISLYIIRIIVLKSWLLLVPLRLLEIVLPWKI